MFWNSIFLRFQDKIYGMSLNQSREDSSRGLSDVGKDLACIDFKNTDHLALYLLL
jgi:hypothetical protein